jgi:hypothetical protein
LQKRIERREGGGAEEGRKEGGREGRREGRREEDTYLRDWLYYYRCTLLLDQHQAYGGREAQKGMRTKRKHTQGVVKGALPGVPIVAALVHSFIAEPAARMRSLSRSLRPPFLLLSSSLFRAS